MEMVPSIVQFLNSTKFSNYPGFIKYDFCFPQSQKYSEIYMIAISFKKTFKSKRKEVTSTIN